MKWDGHTHTQYCLHGSKEPTELFIERAIELGFDTYTVSEHPPLPASFLSRCPYPPSSFQDVAMNEDLLESYFRDMVHLKRKYRDRIRVLVGLEVDHLPGDEQWTRSLLTEYGSHLDDALLSVHHLEGAGGVRGVDMWAQDVEVGLVRHYGGYAEFQRAYYAEVKRALLCGLGPHKPRRIGHLTLCNKFQHCFAESGRPSASLWRLIGEVLDMVKDMGYALDANMAGLFKEHCREPYPSPEVFAAARRMGIPFVYGSDAHAVADVGRGYATFEQLMHG